jgi:hypothetical protein
MVDGTASDRTPGGSHARLVRRHSHSGRKFLCRISISGSERGRPSGQSENTRRRSQAASFRTYRAPSRRPARITQRPGQRARGSCWIMKKTPTRTSFAGPTLVECRHSRQRRRARRESRCVEPEQKDRRNCVRVSCGTDSVCGSINNGALRPLPYFHRTSSRLPAATGVGGAPPQCASPPLPGPIFGDPLSDRPRLRGPPA